MYLAGVGKYPTPAQHAALLETLHAFNAAASYAAAVGFRDHVFTQLSIHRRCYRELRDRFGLSSQMAVRAIGKAVETHVQGGLSEHGVFFLRRVLYPSPRSRVGINSVRLNFCMVAELSDATVRDG